MSSPSVSPPPANAAATTKKEESKSNGYVKWILVLILILIILALMFLFFKTFIKKPAGAVNGNGGNALRNNGPRMNNK